MTDHNYHTDEELKEITENFFDGYNDSISFELPSSFYKDEKNSFFSIIDYIKNFQYQNISFKNVNLQNNLSRKYPSEIPYFFIDNENSLHKELCSHTISLLSEDNDLINKIILLDRSVIFKNDYNLQIIDFNHLEYIKFLNNKEEKYFFEEIIILFKFKDKEEEQFSFSLPKTFIINNQEFSFLYENIDIVKKDILNKILEKYFIFKSNNEIMHTLWFKIVDFIF